MKDKLNINLGYFNMYKDKVFFVAGGKTGFIGSNVTEYLLNQGAIVYAHALSEQKICYIKDHKNLRFIHGDISEGIEIPEDTYCVVNCAAHTSGAKEMALNPYAQVHTNILINSNILEASLKAKVKKYVFISSSAIYPEIDESITEDKAFIGDPPGNYFGPGWMKRYSEKLSEFYHRQHGMDVLIIRPSNIYGRYSGFDLEYSHVLPALIRKCVEAKQNPLEVWGSPDVVRDFIHIDDFVDGVFRAFEYFSGFDVYNISTGEFHTIGESVEIIKSITKFPHEIVYNSSKPTTIKKRKIDSLKSFENFGFKPKVSFEDGLRNTIEWYKSTL